MVACIAVRRSDAIAAAAAVAFAAVLWWAETPRRADAYFFGTWERVNPECAGGRERLRIIESGDAWHGVEWSDPGGHTATARIRFLTSNRLEGALVDIEGVHADNVFNFTFEQIMELTRVTVLLVKQTVPKAQATIDLVAPWGEYYARNQRTIPPVFYADMVAQSGVGFDGIGVQFLFGTPVDGMYVRDMFQISDKLDRLGNLGKPIHVTAVQVPSRSASTGSADPAGCWLKPWDETVQAKWLKEFCTVALSKPFVESITWRDLADREPGPGVIPSGGLLNGDLSPKLSYKVLKEFRSELQATHRKAPAQRSA